MEVNIVKSANSCKGIFKLFYTITQNCLSSLSIMEPQILLLTEEGTKHSHFTKFLNHTLTKECFNSILISKIDQFAEFSKQAFFSVQLASTFLLVR